MTCKNSAKESEQNLKPALKELRSSKDLCMRLLQERKDSEEECRKVVKRNTDLKRNLAELYTNYLDIVSQRDQLINIVTAFDQCSSEHERALDHISEHESDLMQARKLNSDLETCKLNIESQRTHNLYEELVECNILNQIIIVTVVNYYWIDLTKDDLSIVTSYTS